MASDIASKREVGNRDLQLVEDWFVSNMQTPLAIVS